MKSRHNPKKHRIPAQAVLGTTLLLATLTFAACDAMEDGTDEIIIATPPLPSCDQAITEWLRETIVPGDECNFETTCHFGESESLRCSDNHLEVDCAIIKSSDDTDVVTLSNPTDTCPEN